MISEREIEILRHALGFGSQQGQIGWRNHYCAEIGGRDDVFCYAMATLGLMRQGRIINDGRDRYWHATNEGCRAAGMTEADIEAMER